MTSGGAFIWQNATLDIWALHSTFAAPRRMDSLTMRRVGPRREGRRSTGFVYHDFYGGPADAASRLKWVSLRRGAASTLVVVASGFHPQPYRELAKGLRDCGDDAGAAQVLVAAGRRSLLAVWNCWPGSRRLHQMDNRLRTSPDAGVAVVARGWCRIRSAAVSIKKRAGVMAPNWRRRTSLQTRESRTRNCSRLLDSLNQ